MKHRSVLTLHGIVLGMLLFVVTPASMFGFLPPELSVVGQPWAMFSLAYGLLGVGLSLAAQAVSAVPYLRRKLTDADVVTMHYMATQCVALTMIALAFRP